MKPEPIWPMASSCAAGTLALQCLVYLFIPSIGAEDGLIHDGKEAAPYDCHSLSQASMAARQWCCTHQGVACTTQGPTEFNCTSDVAGAFSEEKRLWCCSHESIGCLNTSDLNSTTAREKIEVTENSSNTSVANQTETSEAYDCTTASNASKAWSRAQMTWCCQHGACGNESTTFDCSDAGEWSELKKSWCCQHFGLACPDEKVAKSAVNISSDNQSVTNDSVHNDAAAMVVDAMVVAVEQKEANKTQGDSGTSVLSDHKDAYDCVKGASNWTLEWTNEQAIWCCKFRNVSCNAGHPLNPMSQPFDCTGSMEDWSLSKQQWCCDTHQLGCTTPSTTSTTSAATQAGVEVADQFDCDKEGYWSRSRQAWCCKNKKIGCHSCTEDAEKWSIPEKLWCCEHRPSRACLEAPSVSLPHQASHQFQCNLGDVETWSEEERAWCCKTKSQGCDPDCDLVFLPQWTPSQQIWCCKMKGLGCPAQQTSALFDCFDGDTEGWSQMKSHWCCFHAKRGCPMFDCEDGYSNWRLGFSEAKKAWCCEHYGMACERSSSSSSDPSQQSEPSFSQEGPFAESHDCDGDPQEWSATKLQWCCLVEHRGCLNDLQKELEEAYDCRDVSRSSVWPPEKTAWCCFEKGVACEVESFTVQRPPPPEQSQEDDSSLYFVLLLLVVIVIISYYRAKGGHSRRSFSFGPSPSSGTTYGRGVYSALGSRYTPPSLPS